MGHRFDGASQQFLQFFNKNDIFLGIFGLKFLQNSYETPHVHSQKLFISGANAGVCELSPQPRRSLGALLSALGDFYDFSTKPTYF